MWITCLVNTNVILAVDFISSAVDGIPSHVLSIPFCDVRLTGLEPALSMTLDTAFEAAVFAILLQADNLVYAEGLEPS